MLLLSTPSPALQELDSCVFKQKLFESARQLKKAAPVVVFFFALAAGTCSKEGGDCVIKGRQEGLQ